MPSGTSRRQFVGAGVAAAAWSLIGFPGRGVGLVSAESTTAADLPPECRTVYVALVDALGRIPGNQLDSSQATSAAATFGKRYGAMSAESQDAISAALRAIRTSSRGVEFGDLPPSERVTELQQWLRPGKPPFDSPVQAQLDHALLAVTCAAVPFYPDPLEAHPPDVFV